ncbi:hypothetical protein Acsp03_44990 [Actinomadura sp. NBRC 104412]|nr:hypothetical protein Acsp03_44990 [Actinomadura sp. NBRC 104412]
MPVSDRQMAALEMRRFAGDTSGVVYDPACGVGDLLPSVGGDGVSARVGQDVAEGRRSSSGCARRPSGGAG